MAKLGRPIKPDAKRDGIKLRLSREEAAMLDELSRETGLCRTDILLENVRKEIESRRKDENYSDFSR